MRVVETAAVAACAAGLWLGMALGAPAGVQQRTLDIGGVTVWMGEPQTAALAALSAKYKLLQLPSPLGYAVQMPASGIIGGVSFDSHSRLSGAQRELPLDRNSSPAIIGAYYQAVADMQLAGGADCHLAATQGQMLGGSSRRVALDCGGRGLVMSTTRMGNAPADAELMEWMGDGVAVSAPVLPRSTAPRAISLRR